MSVDTTMAVLYAQSGLSTNVANAAMVAPQASLAMARVLAAESARQEREQVKKNEKADEALIRKEEGDSGKGFRYGRLGARRRMETTENEVAENLLTTATLGNLLNVKV